MRYMLITYFRKADGKIDEVMTVSKNVKTKDIQTCSVILDFKKLEVVKCTLEGQNLPKDWDKILTYFYQYYESTITRLLKENGYKIKKEEQPNEQTIGNAVALTT
jgi:hypothetical protein